MSESNPSHAAPHASSNATSHSILSEKVNRALQVRSDTAAMKAALDALSHLPSADIDSRSVRVAIEQDALQQALLLKKELKSLVTTVQTLRQGVSATAALARKVKAATQQTVLTAETPAVMLPGSTATTAAGETKESEEVASITSTSAATATATVALTAASTASASSLNGLADEMALANQLADAFVHRDMARKRLQAVHAFLERFDLSQEDSRLLDHYNFEDMTPSADTENRAVVNGLAFLRALERVRHIRVALTDTFGPTTTETSAGEFNLGSETSDHAITSSATSNRRGLGASSALRMMESLAQKQERAYERLYHWLQQYLHLFSTSGSASASNTTTSTQTIDTADALDEALQHVFVKRSLYTLRHVPAFYSHTLELIASSRRAEETRRFLLALTSGYAGMQPIEMKAHDPVAYVGDMLAFSFKAFSVEGDLAKGLLDYHPRDEEEEEESLQDKDMGDESHEKSASKTYDTVHANLEKSISSTDMLSIAMSGLSRPLKSRILQVVSTLSRRPEDEEDDDNSESDDGMLDDFEEEGAMVRSRVTHLYEICGLLLFYKSAMEKSIQKMRKHHTSREQADDRDVDVDDDDDVNPLIASLTECLCETTNGYEATTRAYGAMLTQVSSMTGDTEASQAQSMLSLLADVRLSSPGFQDVDCPAECQTILSMEWVTKTLAMAALGRANTTLDDVLALRASVRAAEKAGLGATAATQLETSMSEKEAVLITALVQQETKKVLDLCGLASVVQAWRLWQKVPGSAEIEMSSFPGLAQDPVEEGIKDFYASLYSPPLPSLETQVKDPLLRKKARSQIAQEVARLYAELHQCISSGGGYEDVSFLIHTPEQVQTLFSA